MLLQLNRHDKQKCTIKSFKKLSNIFFVLRDIKKGDLYYTLNYHLISLDEW